MAIVWERETGERGGAPKVTVIFFFNETSAGHRGECAIKINSDEYHYTIAGIFWARGYRAVLRSNQSAREKARAENVIKQIWFATV